MNKTVITFAILAYIGMVAAVFAADSVICCPSYDEGGMPVDKSSSKGDNKSDKDDDK